MAQRESRSTRRRLVLYVTAITLGVAALVAINSFRTSMIGAVREQARSLLGADLQIRSRWEYPEVVETAIDSLRATGVDVSRVTSFTSMALATRSGLTRLVRVRAVSGGYPYYGELETEPPDLWQAFRSSRNVLVDPAVLIQLDAEVGDTLAIGEARFIIAGAVTSVPGDVGIRAAVGPRVYIPVEYLEETGLLRFGSVARYLTYFRFDDTEAIDPFLESQDSVFKANRIGDTTVEEYEEDLTEGLDQLASFLGLVRIVASFGEGALAGYTIAIRVIVFVLLPAWGVGNAAATLVGQNLGAKNPERGERAVWLTGHFNAAFLALVAVVFFVFPEALAGFFTEDPAALVVAADCLRIVSLSYVFWAYGMVTVVAFNGAGDTTTPTWLHLWAYWVLQIPLAWLLALPLGLGPRGVFIAIAVGQAALAAMGVWAFRRGKWKTQAI